MIVGGGIIGATIAYELSLDASWEVTLIDRDAPGTASTGAALGILMGIISQKTKGRAWHLREASMRRYPHLLAQLREETGASIPQVQGLLNLCYTEQEWEQWQELASVRDRAGWELQCWDSDQLQQACPGLNIDPIAGAVYSPQDFQVNPQALTQALIQGCEQNGVKCYWPVAAIAAAVSEQGAVKHCNRVQTTEGDWDTDYLIIAAGLGSFPLTRELQQPLPLRPVFGQAMRVRLDHNLMTPEFQPVITGDDAHIVPLGDNEYWLGATVEFQDQPVTTTLEQVREKAIRHYPALARAEIIETWSGERPRPEGQAAPVIEFLKGYDNVILATGHYRNGVLLAPATAELVKELIIHHG